MVFARRAGQGHVLLIEEHKRPNAEFHKFKNLTIAHTENTDFLRGTREKREKTAVCTP
jgi:predicted nicotinamide N-methyase